MLDRASAVGQALGQPTELVHPKYLKLRYKYWIVSAGGGGRKERGRGGMSLSRMERFYGALTTTPARLDGRKSK